MSTTHTTTLGGNGWAGVEKLLKEYGIGNRTLNVPKHSDFSAPEVIVQFLEDEPYATWRVHPVTEGYVTCLDDDCPLCKADHKSMKGVGFNVLMMTNQGHEVRTLAVTGKELGTVQNYLARYQREHWYFNLKRTEIGVTPFPVKPEDMEYWGIVPPAAGYVPGPLFTDSPMVTLARREMAGLASEIVDKREAIRVKRETPKTETETQTPGPRTRAARRAKEMQGAT